MPATTYVCVTLPPWPVTTQAPTTCMLPPAMNERLDWGIQSSFEPVLVSVTDSLWCRPGCAREFRHYSLQYAVVQVHSGSRPCRGPALPRRPPVRWARRSGALPTPHGRVGPSSARASGFCSLATPIVGGTVRVGGAAARLHAWCRARRRPEPCTAGRQRGGLVDV